MEPPFERELVPRIQRAARAFGAVVVSGPRRAGKTFLLRQTLPNASYHLLEDPDILARVKSDPRGWLESVRTPAILDEIQNAPELFSYVRTLIDERPNRHGQWFLTGSQEFSLMSGVAESMAGRAAIFQLLPLSFREIGSWDLLRGGFPEVVLRPKSQRLWFSSYLQTYLERDVRAITAVKDLITFRRFLALLASRHGQTLNKSAIAPSLGVSVPTIASWLSILEATGQIILVPPYFENFGKRLIKSPKVYWVDSGLVSLLLGIETRAELERSPFLGSIFEGFIAAEITKNRVNRGLGRDLYFFRDEQGLEVDFLTVGAGGTLRLIEVKWSTTVKPEMALPLQRLGAAIKRRPFDAVVVHRAPARGAKMTVLAPGVRAVPVEEFLGSATWR